MATPDHETPPLIDAPAHGSTLLRLEGRDALDLLHRISTAFLTDLAPGQARATLFCDFRARLQHRVVVARLADGNVWLLRDDAPAGPLAADLDRHIFREDVRVIEETARVVQRVPGRTALGWGTLRERDGVPEQIQVSESFALDVALEPAVERDRATERERIALGLPRHGHEIAGEFTPFEVGLAHEVHLDKGCFTGQEALMRLITYQSVRRRLARVSGAGEPPSVPGEVRMNGERAGRLTSATTIETPLLPDELADQPAGLGGWIGLAVLKHEACEPGVRLTLESGEEIADVEPFPLTRPLGLP